MHRAVKPHHRAKGKRARTIIRLPDLATRVLSSIVYQATPNDPLILGGVVLTMLGVGILAASIPADSYGAMASYINEGLSVSSVMQTQLRDKFLP